MIAAVLLAALITYSFSVAAYSTSKLHNKFNFDGMGSTDNNQTGCSSLSGCTLLALNYGSLQSVFWQEDPQSIGTVEASLFNFGFVFILQV